MLGLSLLVILLVSAVGAQGPQPPGTTSENTSGPANDEKAGPEPRVDKHDFPRYPDRPRRAKTEGVVVVKVMLTEAGEVRAAEIIESEPRGIFDRAVLDPLKRWHYAVPASWIEAHPDGSLLLEVDFQIASCRDTPGYPGAWQRLRVCAGTEFTPSIDTPLVLSDSGSTIEVKNLSPALTEPVDGGTVFQADVTYALDAYDPNHAIYTLVPMFESARRPGETFNSLPTAADGLRLKNQAGTVHWSYPVRHEWSTHSLARPIRFRILIMKVTHRHDLEPIANSDVYEYKYQ